MESVQLGACDAQRILEGDTSTSMNDRVPTNTYTGVACSTNGHYVRDDS